jgi:hypothetical protein
MIGWLMTILHVVLFFILRKKITKEKKELRKENDRLRLERIHSDVILKSYKKMLDD